MKYKIQDSDESFDGKILENYGDNEYKIKINDNEYKLKIINMNSRGMEFVLNQQYHSSNMLTINK